MSHIPSRTWHRLSIPESVNRIRADYLAMPSLHLTLPQALRLWALDEATGTSLLAMLVDTGFLRRTWEGAYALRDAGACGDGPPAWSVPSGRDSRRGASGTFSMDAADACQSTQRP